MTPLPPHNLSGQGKRRRFLWFAIAYILVWIAVGHVDSMVGTLDRFGLLYLPSGLRFSCLFALGWVGLWLDLAAQTCLMLLNLAFNRATLDIPWHLQLFQEISNLLVYSCSYAVVVLPLRKRLRGTVEFTIAAHSLLFVVAALVASALAAVAGTCVLAYQGMLLGEQWAQAFGAWLLGDFAGVLALSPLLLVIVCPRIRHFVLLGSWPKPRLQIAGQPAASLYWYTSSILLVALVLLLGLPKLLGSTQQPTLMALLLLPPLVLVAQRFKLNGAVLAIALLDGSLAMMVNLMEQQDVVLQYQLVMIAIALLGLGLGGSAEALDRVTLRLQDFLSTSNDLLWETTSMGVLSIGGRLAAQMVYQPGGSWRSMLASNSQPCPAMLEQSSENRQAFCNLEVAVQSRTDATLWLHVTGTPCFDAMGEFSGFRGTATDISDAVRVAELLHSYNRELLTEVAQRTADLDRSNAELAAQEQHLRVLLAAVPVGVLELDERDCCCYLNFHGSVLMDCTLNQALGMPLMNFVHPDDHDQVQMLWSARDQLGAVQSLEFRLHRNNTWCAAYWIKFNQTDERQDRTIMVLVDATSQHQKAEHLWTLAHTDLLTGLPNRNLFLDRCTQALTLAKRLDIGAALFWIDLDGFKSVNDTFGHAAGDAMLNNVARRLLSRIRNSDTAARIGGDEFVVIMTDVSGAENALRLAKELIGVLRQPYDLPQGTAQISASIGIAHYPMHASTVEDLMRLADGAMYRAKHAGKDQVQEWNPENLDDCEISIRS